ncbi:MAPK regulated corepressor interacting protein 2 [Erpetoichthys calabaricus]|uniref:MAPK regulated corepressor interacting protein 2 n=1 Tax=Erpetoichthys calabaricus TaxID=27687 RepID=A0A8C4SIS7_ERPCA|nr:MAPK regulated corepressor interacting protein 2 [Erpetoichthys calabaricus]
MLPARLRVPHMMYTITKGPSKLVTQRRTGPTQQQIDTKVGEQKPKPAAWSPSNPTPKLVFNRLNGKRFRTAPIQADSPQEDYSAAHEENVRFIYEAWQEVEQQLKEPPRPENGDGPVQYSEKCPNPVLKNFVPIDLEEFWAQRVLAIL